MLPSPVGFVKSCGTAASRSSFGRRPPCAPRWPRRSPLQRRAWHLRHRFLKSLSFPVKLQHQGRISLEELGTTAARLDLGGHGFVDRPAKATQYLLEGPDLDRWPPRFRWRVDSGFRRGDVQQCLHHRARDREVVDLTLTLDSELEVFAAGDCRDPPFEVSTWSTIESKGFWVSKLALGTQTDTHIDAPAHCPSQGVALDTLSPRWLVERFFVIDPPSSQAVVEDWIARDYRAEPILFLSDPGKREATCSRQWAETFCDFPVPVWASATQVRIAGEDDHAFHMLLAEQSEYFVEDLDCGACARIKKGDTLVIVPLKLRRSPAQLAASLQ